MENYGPPYHYNQNQPYGYPPQAYGASPPYPPQPNSTQPYPPQPNSAQPYPPNYGYPPQHHPPYQYQYNNTPPYPPSGHPPSTTTPVSPHNRPYPAPNFDYQHSAPPPYPYPYPAPGPVSPQQHPGYYDHAAAYSSQKGGHPRPDAFAYPSSDNTHLSDNQPKPSAPASQGHGHMATPPYSRYDMSPGEIGHDPNARHENRTSFYGGQNDSLSNNWEPTYPAPPAFPKHARSQSLSETRPTSSAVVPYKTSMQVLLVHGNLDIWVYEAKNLPNMDLFSRTLEDVINRVACNGGSKYHGHPQGTRHRNTSDPYVSITLSNAVIGRTYVINNSENPVWMQHFNVPVAHYATEVQFLVKDSDVMGSQIIGVVSIPVEEIITGVKLEGTYPIYNSSGKPLKSGTNLSLSVQYYPVQELALYRDGIGTGPDYSGVPDTYFPLRKGGRVTLYQDAHAPDGFLPSLELDHGAHYVHGKCWYDIFDAIRHARRLIYITGWSVWYKVKLVRDAGPAQAAESSLGELLRSKSAEGVRVLLLIWDDPTSRNILGYKTDGIMATHDEETRRFFKHSSVQVLLCPRIAGKKNSWMKQKEVGTIYTHHQKTVIVDGDASNNRRQIVAFVGGLDICDGRYDTPEHPIFRTLNTVHSDDYHNPTYTGSTEGCPREPWHDLHSKIVGPAAYDVLTNFEERWLKASKPTGIKKLKKLYDDALLKIERIPDILKVNEASSDAENDPESWHVQIFRSIDSNSVKGFPKDPKAATSKNLMCGKNLLIDMSIHTAYVKAIRAAQHFIYIENQYFIGSSHNWSSYKELGANNLIPMEIALKIADKIRANERFAAYIVVPMWPEGVPTGAATQRILFWQHKTMQMMYETIYKALVEVGLEDVYTPQDYLLFFCLGNRETYEGMPNPVPGGGGTSAPAPSQNAAHTPEALSKRSRRFMIYVHSKGMIVDDEFVIVGSANINQRSMEGMRDTEIAMGAYQPQYTWAKNQSNPRGQIHGYRMSLWAEHTGTVEECFMHPESLECVKRVKMMGNYNWKQFSADEVTEMRGHLMKYPVEVDQRGKVRPIPGQETFPDVGGNICGSFLAIQENLTI